VTSTAEPYALATNRLNDSAARQNASRRPKRICRSTAGADVIMP
jgi:hypothetical protein